MGGVLSKVEVFCPAIAGFNGFAPGHTQAWDVHQPFPKHAACARSWLLVHLRPGDAQLRIPAAP